MHCISSAVNSCSSRFSVLAVVTNRHFCADTVKHQSINLAHSHAAVNERIMKGVHVHIVISCYHLPGHSKCSSLVLRTLMLYACQIGGLNTWLVLTLHTHTRAHTHTHTYRVFISGLSRRGGFQLGVKLYKQCSNCLNYSPTPNNVSDHSHD